MEKVVINKLDMKGNMLIVGIDGKGDATMNKGWQEQEIYFLQNEVGIGGSVELLIVQKGQYTNITEVNMDQGTYTKGDTTAKAPSEVRGSSSEVNRQMSIESQAMTKVTMEIALSQGVSMDSQKVLEIADNVVATFKYIKSKI